MAALKVFCETQRNCNLLDVHIMWRLPNESLAKGVLEDEFVPQNLVIYSSLWPGICTYDMCIL